MQIVIEIPENDYNQIREYYEKNEIVEATYSYIYHGTVLPENHGRLIDADELKKEYPHDTKKQRSYGTDERISTQAVRRSTWISTSDRNPGSDGRYLVSTDGFDVEIAYYQNGAWHKASQIIAWMPLPNTYREGDI